MQWPHNKALVSVDLGAQSCRVSLLRSPGGRPEIEILHRFPNGPVVSAGGLRWEIGRIFDGVTAGLRKCASAAPEGIASIAVDGWGVDYVRLDATGRRLADPFCHRDERATRAMRELFLRLPPERLYALTGIQLLALNTLFQLYADNLAGVDPQARWLNLPEYITHLLGGQAVSEYTNATHTQLVALGSREWCDEIFREAGLAKAAAPRIVPSGTVVGTVSGELRELPAFSGTALIVPACHDTASALAGIPASGDDWAFISSGTWSLVGTLLRSPCVTEEARRMNFTNLGGVGGTICFLKNVNGMWLLGQCMEEWKRAGLDGSLAELLESCGRLPAPPALVDVDEAPLLLPGDMPGKIAAQLRSAGAAPPSRDDPRPETANLILHSLAKRYAEVLESVARITGKRLKRLYIVGGGSKNERLNRLTEERSGLEVIRGSSESATVGNFAIQLATLETGAGNSAEVGADRVAGYAQFLSSHCRFAGEEEAGVRGPLPRQEI
jgi:rhamnulokinase